jgi:hypothetical protein
VLIVAITAAAYGPAHRLIPLPWLAVGLTLGHSGPPGALVYHLSVPVLLALFAVANSALRTAAQRRLRQVRAVARVAQSALLREVSPTVTAARLASRYVSAAAEARVGGDVLEVVPDLQASTFTVSPGDRLVFYTDGLLEARDRTGRFFRLEDCLRTLRDQDLQPRTACLPSSMRTRDVGSTTTSHCCSWKLPP